MAKGSNGSWTFLTNHAHALVCLSRDPHLTMRELAAMVGVTERAINRILNDLEEGGAISRERHGRRNSYSIHRDVPLRHDVEAGHTVGELLHAVAEARQRLAKN